jgi:hypothetical protein
VQPGRCRDKYAWRGRWRINNLGSTINAERGREQGKGKYIRRKERKKSE